MTVVTVGDVVLTGATRVSEAAGWNAPEKRAETGFEYDSYVRAEPVEATIEAYVDDQQYRKLQSLREEGEPFPASIGPVNLTLAKLLNLDTENQASQLSHYTVTIEIREIQQAEIATAELSISTPSGDMGTAAAESEPSIAYPEDGDGGGGGGDDGGGGGIVDSLSSFREDLSGFL